MKEIVSTMTSKGQVTIPVEIRRHLGLDAHDRLSFVIEEDGTVRLKAPRYPDIASVVGAAGSLKEPLSWDQVKAIVQEDRVAEYVRKSG